MFAFCIAFIFSQNLKGFLSSLSCLLLGIRNPKSGDSQSILEEFQLLVVDMIFTKTLNMTGLKCTLGVCTSYFVLDFADLMFKRMRHFKDFALK